MKGLFYEGIENEEECNRYEYQGHDWIAQGFVGTRVISEFTSEDEDPEGSQSEENPVGEHDIGDKVLKGSPEKEKDHGPERLNEYGVYRCSEARVNPSEPFKKEPVAGHGKIYAGG